MIENENMIWGEFCPDNTLFSKNKKFFPEMHPLGIPDINSRHYCRLIAQPYWINLVARLGDD